MTWSVASRRRALSTRAATLLVRPCAGRAGGGPARAEGGRVRRPPARDRAGSRSGSRRGQAQPGAGGRSRSQSPPGPGGGAGRAGRPVRSGAGEEGRQEPHQPGEGAQAAPGGRPARAPHVPPPGLSGQPGHGQDHCGPAAGQDLPGHRGAVQGRSWWRWTAPAWWPALWARPPSRPRRSVQKALGGVLFIDEAYALVNQDSANDFGREAIEVLPKNMEDHRDDLIVIAAGYYRPDGEVHPLQPGPGSPGSTNTSISRTTPAPSCMEIFQSMCNRGGYALSPEGARRGRAGLSGRAV